MKLDSNIRCTHAHIYAQTQLYISIIYSTKKKGMLIKFQKSGSHPCLDNEWLSLSVIRSKRREEVGEKKDAGTRDKSTTSKLASTNC